MSKLYEKFKSSGMINFSNLQISSFGVVRVLEIFFHGGVVFGGRRRRQFRERAVVAVTGWWSTSGGRWSG